MLTKESQSEFYYYKSWYLLCVFHIKPTFLGCLILTSINLANNFNICQKMRQNDLGNLISFTNKYILTN